ncbi:MAG: hypothetical protein WA477_10860 [Candidatus Sulfotelmatobacter sp.]
MRLFLTLLLTNALAAALAPPQTPQQLALDRDAWSLLEKDFTAFDSHYTEERETRVARTKELAKQMFAEEAKGAKTACGHQILFELGSLLISSADFKLIDSRLHDLEASIGHPSSDKADNDGMWGFCYQEWYLKLYATYDHLEANAPDEPSPHPLPAFLARVSTPQKLTSYLDSLSISDVRHMGVDHEREFNETLATLLQMIVRRKPENYTVDPALRDALLDRVLHHYRNADTGYFGERYRRDGREDFPDDLSMTFHVVSYLKGRVPDMPKVLGTTLAIKDFSYPAGWLWKGEFWNHNNMDVVALFRLGWSQATPGQKKAISTEIDRMLSWCLHDSLQADGSFKVTIADGSLEDAEYYGTSFLARIGFFDQSQRFWTDRDFPEAADVKKRILTFVHAHRGSGPTGDNYKSTLEALGVR